ncbi:hypothetical protein AB0O28_08145 [Microbispora sp. NPDC088329]
MTGFPAGIRLVGLGPVLREWTAEDLPVMVELFGDLPATSWPAQRAR